MKIFIDGSKRAAVRRMFPIWQELGHKVVSNAQTADVQLSVIKIKNKNIPTVLRLDGVYYDKAGNFKGLNADISRSHSIADGIIYQSNLSKSMCEKYLAKRRTNLCNVVYNGIDLNDWQVFRRHDDINIVSCAKWRRPKRLPETIEIFAEFLNYYPNAKLHILGPMKKGAKVIKHINVIYHNPNKKIGFEEIKKIYETCDIYIHLCKKDSCPSSVVEAIGTGIPVVTTNACGGATEMCELTPGCVIIPGESESLEPDYIYKDTYNRISNEVKGNIVDAIVEIAKSKIRVVLPDELTIETTAKKYIRLMEKIV